MNQVEAPEHKGRHEQRRKNGLDGRGAGVVNQPSINKPTYERNDLTKASGRKPFGSPLVYLRELIQRPISALDNGFGRFGHDKTLLDQISMQHELAVGIYPATG